MFDDNYSNFRAIAVMYVAFYDCFIAQGKDQELSLVLANELTKTILETNKDKNDDNFTNTQFLS